MLEKVIAIICDYQGIAADTITPETHLVSDLELNSYDVVALVTQFEDEFGIEIPDRSIKKLQTVSDISKYMEELLCSEKP